MVKIDTTSAAAQSQPPPPTGVVVCPWTLLIDTREQHPWSFTSMTIGCKQWIVPRERATLATGDYAIDGFQSQCVIERKSADDLVGSVCGGHKRFEREHERMLDMVEDGGQACVIVEGSMSKICEELDADGRWKAKRTLLGCVASWPFKYRVPWLFAGSRRMAEELAFLVLQKWFDNLSR